MANKPESKSIKTPRNIKKMPNDKMPAPISNVHYVNSDYFSGKYLDNYSANLTATLYCIE